ncbi:PucR C-terminal helix-turn-helix domain-containing protein [Modestobacter sp. DSM 44400]|uniref:PucR family transcriptional regulator n=1 Tax=Modestobacter sp. DSM 44400 TaxID=1550230 RepID=UPI000899C75D|nr:helix-turn-helix domain-containing protein [Modestobacter sp. DSM 44400]SDY05208.1 PucR C-terminal helix-turn-helix domain-containing protein [Modestobacter sp. DSM 44400]
MASAETTPAISFGDEGVAITSLLANDVDSTRAWVAEVLGPLAIDTAATRLLRETLRVFLLNGENYTDTAAAINLHRNTVQYRVTKASQHSGAPVSSSWVDLAVALNVCHFLGPAVLDVVTTRG